jgi:hypothetical protein
VSAKVDVEGWLYRQMNAQPPRSFRQGLVVDLKVLNAVAMV